jgi:hypothetical protein
MHLDLPEVKFMGRNYQQVLRERGISSEAERKRMQRAGERPPAKLRRAWSACTQAERAAFLAAMGWGQGPLGGSTDA